MGDSRDSARPRRRDNAGEQQPPDLAQRLALRPREAAAVLGVSERSLRQIATELPRVCRGGLVLYPVEGLREWLRREARVDGDRIEAAVEAALGRLSSD